MDLFLFISTGAALKLLPKPASLIFLISGSRKRGKRGRYLGIRIPWFALDKSNGFLGAEDR